MLRVFLTDQNEKIKIISALSHYRHVSLENANEELRVSIGKKIRYISDVNIRNILQSHQIFQTILSKL